MHQQFSPDCWRGPDTLPECMQIGLGPHEFDCSGLVLRALADVSGNADIEPAVRHSRQIWADAQGEQRHFVPAQEEVGNLALFAYRWDTPEGERWVPAHIAIVSAVPADSPTRVVHSRSSEGLVMETPLNRRRLLGFVAIRRELAATPAGLLAPSLPTARPSRAGMAQAPLVDAHS